MSLFIKNAGYLLSGSFLSQLLLLAASPVLSRAYSPEDFGIFASYTAWVVVLAAVFSLRYDHAVYQVRGVTKGFVVAFVVLVSAISFSLLSYLIVHFFGSFQDGWRHVIYLIPLGALGVVLFSIANQLSIRFGNFSAIAKFVAVLSIFTVSFQLIFAKFGFEYGLVLGSIAGNVLTFISIVLYYLVRTKNIKVLKKRLGYALSPTWGFRIALDNKGFPIYSMPSEVLSLASSQFVPFIVLLLYGATPAGLFAFSLRLVRAPAVFLGTTISSLIRHRASEDFHNKKSLLSLYLKCAKWLSLIAIPVFSIIAIIPDVLYAFVFGSDWIGISGFIKIMTIGIIAEFISIPIKSFYYQSGGQKLFFMLSAFNIFLLFLVSLYAFLQGVEINIFIGLISLVSLISGFLLFIFGYKYLKKIEKLRTS